jgi:hypothetical protein
MNHLSEEADDDGGITTSDGTIQRSHAIVVNMLDLGPVLKQKLNL